MPYVAVDVVLKDTMGAPVEGAVAQVRTVPGMVAVNTLFTDAQGVAQFLLLDGATYEVRFQKNAYSIPSGRITVSGPSAFDVVATPWSPPASLDPSFCLLYAQFTRHDGSPYSNLPVKFLSRFACLWFGGKGMMSHSNTVLTDGRGCLQIYLPRKLCFDVLLEAYEDHAITIEVPDLPSANLVDLLYPLIVDVSFNPAVPASLMHGQSATLVATLTNSLGTSVDGSEEIQWLSSEPSILAVTGRGRNITLEGLSPGVAQLTFQRLKAVRLPEPGLPGLPAVITVT